MRPLYHINVKLWTLYCMMKSYPHCFPLGLSAITQAKTQWTACQHWPVFHQGFWSYEEALGMQERERERLDERVESTKSNSDTGYIRLRNTLTVSQGHSIERTHTQTLQEGFPKQRGWANARFTCYDNAAVCAAPWLRKDCRDPRCAAQFIQWHNSQRKGRAWTWC